jgi:hypothetical protein
MPNGHGGIPKYGSPFLLFLVLGVLALLKRSYDAEWTVYAAYPAAVLFGWRFAWHFHLYDVMEYDGAHATPEKLAVTRRRYRIGMVAWIAAAVGATFAIWSWGL